MKTAKLLGLLIGVAAARSSYAQQTMAVPNLDKLPPQIEKFRDLLKPLLIKPDLIALEVGAAHTCQYIGVRNQGFRPAPASSTTVRLCHWVDGPDHHGFVLCEAVPLAFPTPELLPQAGYILPMDFRSKVNPGDSLKVTADAGPNSTVQESDEQNNEAIVTCIQASP